MDGSLNGGATVLKTVGPNTAWGFESLAIRQFAGRRTKWVGTPAPPRRGLERLERLASHEPMPTLECFCGEYLKVRAMKARPSDKGRSNAPKIRRGTSTFYGEVSSMVERVTVAHAIRVRFPYLAPICMGDPVAKVADCKSVTLETPQVRLLPHAPFLKGGSDGSL